MPSVAVKVRFSASHYLPLYGGACAWHHGHDWLAEVEIAADRLDENGFVVEFGAVKAAVRVLDHRCINAFPPFQRTDTHNVERLGRLLNPDGLAPTTENVARWIGEQVQAVLDRLDNRPRLLRVTVQETENQAATVHFAGAAHAGA